MVYIISVLCGERCFVDCVIIVFALNYGFYKRWGNNLY